MTTQTIRITSTSDEKSHVNPLAYTRARKTDRQRRLFIVTAPYNCKVPSEMLSNPGNCISDTSDQTAQMPIIQQTKGEKCNRTTFNIDKQTIHYALHFDKK